MYKEKKNVFGIITFVLVLGAIVWLGFMTYKAYNEKKEWKCSQLVCEEGITAEQWAKDNCFVQQDNSTACAVMINGVKRLVPASQIDPASVTQCFKARCLQEVNVKAVNYTIDLTKNTTS